MGERGPGLWEVVPDAEAFRGPGACWGEQAPELRKRGCGSGVERAYLKDRDIAIDEFLQYPHLVLPTPICLEHAGCKQQGQVPRAHLVQSCTLLHPAGGAGVVRDAAGARPSVNTSIHSANTYRIPAVHRPWAERLGCSSE